MYLQQEKESDIDSENLNFNDKPLVFEKQVGFPYNDLQPRDFERLIYCLYKKDIVNKHMENDQYDDIQLMQGVGERGRDCILLKDGVIVGVIQCKRYKNNIDRSEVGKEIIKFILHYTQDNKLIASLDCFTYIIAVSYGFSEKALDLINSLTNNTYDKGEIESWANGIIQSTQVLKSLTFDSVKDTIYDALDKTVFNKVIPENLSLMIEEYAEIKTMFFDFKKVIDIKSFERLLIEREKEKIELIGKSSELEKALDKKNPYLYSKVQDTKKIAQDWINTFDANFILYTNHTKKHTENLIKVLGEKLLDKNDIDDLNEYELYVLSIASYLHDIGICISNEVIEKKHKEYIGDNKSYNFLELDEYIREQHTYLTYDFILSHWKELKIEYDWKEAIALVAGMNENIDIFEYEYFEYAPYGGRKKVCIPFLNALIQLTDMIDVESINANYLFRNYKDMEEYKYSKKLWEEVYSFIKSKIADDNRLIFEGECDNQLLYLALNRHVHELKQRFEELNSKIRKYRYPYKFSISYIEENLNTPFSKKIGFNLDYNGIAEMLIGKNIYDDEFDALRESIQNSLDSCNLKAIKNEKGYVPRIEVELTHKDIIIRDNGMGMDEFIIENYFAKLCKSYYKDYGLDSIGQFGIGVFSYFMMCDSFTVETNIKEGNVIKFKAYKNLNSFFYFYEDNFSQSNEGTIITLHLKESILKKLSFKLLKKKINEYFKFINIPIVAKYGEESIAIGKENFSLDIEVDLMNKIKYSARNEIEKFKFLESYIDNDEFEGVCGLIFENSSFCDYKPVTIDLLMGMESHFYKNIILLCQKGIIIKNAYSHIRLKGVFTMMLGKINIKKNYNLDLARSNFKDDMLYDILHKFEIDLLKKFFNSIKPFEPKKAYLLNAEFLELYFNEFYFNYKGLEQFILDNFYVRVFIKEKTEYMLLSKLISKYEQFILTGGEKITDQEVNSKSANIDIPLIYIEESRFCKFYFDFFKWMNYEFTLDDSQECNLIINITNIIQNKIKIFYYLAIPFNNNLLFNRIETIDKGITLYNINHPIIQLFIRNFEYIDNDIILSDKFENFLTFIDNVYENKPFKISLPESNKFLDEIVYTFNSSINITIEDFPEKVRKIVSE